jgi:hypothetical protein
VPKNKAVRVTPSTGNVFRDLGFSKEESEHLLVRADLLIQVVDRHAGAAGHRRALGGQGVAGEGCVTKPRLCEDLAFVNELTERQTCFLVTVMLHAGDATY